MIIEGVLGGIFLAFALTLVSVKLYPAYEHGMIWKRDYSLSERGRYVSVVTEHAQFWWGVGFYVAWIVLLMGYTVWRARKHYRAYRAGRVRAVS